MTIERRLPPGKYRLQAEDYERLAFAGAFGDNRTELIEGDVVVMSPQYRPHGMVKLGLYDELRAALRSLGSALRPVTEFTLALSQDSQPDPDVMLTTEPRGAQAVPLASVALVIEVADTTLTDDLGKKQRLYAAARIPEYWVADVNGRTIHQMWAPASETYTSHREITFGAVMTAQTIPGLTISTADL